MKAAVTFAALWCALSTSVRAQDPLVPAGGDPVVEQVSPAESTTTPPGDSLPATDLPAGDGETGGDPPDEGDRADAEDPLIEGSDQDADTPVEAAAWVPISADERLVDGVPLLGPWPDAWEPEVSGQAGLPTIDIITTDVLDPGHPYTDGVLVGPAPPPPDVAPVEPEAAPPEPDHGPPEALGGTPDPEDESAPAADAAAEAPEADAASAATSPPAEQPAAAPSASGAVATSLADALRIHPMVPPIGAGVLALLLLVTLPLTALAERVATLMPAAGLVPILLRGLAGIMRVVTVALVVLATLALLPPSWGAIVPFVLVAMAVAVGWSTRGLLGDLFAGVVLMVEHRLAPGDRVEVGQFRGRVVGLGPRTLQLRTDDGPIVSVPNAEVARNPVRLDPDPYPVIVVPVHAPAGARVGHVHQLLEELILCSPYLAPSRQPHVYRDPDREHVWLAEARIVDIRYAKAFRSAIVELADELFHGPTARPTTLDADVPPGSGDDA